MKNKQNLFQKAGLLLIAASLCLLLSRELLGWYYCRQNELLADQIETMLPKTTTGIPETYSNSDMPVLELGGEDYSGLLQVSGFGVHLPIGNEWSISSSNKCPCRFWGSVYDHSLIIGGSSQKGQFDFCRKLDLGDTVSVTDMTGAIFFYEVTGIDRRGHADMKTFRESDGDLILFARDSSTLGYLIVRCSFSPI